MSEMMKASLLRTALGAVDDQPRDDGDSGRLRRVLINRSSPAAGVDARPTIASALRTWPRMQTRSACADRRLHRSARRGPRGTRKVSHTAKVRLAGGRIGSRAQLARIVHDVHVGDGSPAIKNSLHGTTDGHPRPLIHLPPLRLNRSSQRPAEAHDVCRRIGGGAGMNEGFRRRGSAGDNRGASAFVATLSRRAPISDKIAAGSPHRRVMA